MEKNPVCMVVFYSDVDYCDWLIIFAVYSRSAFVLWLSLGFECR